MISFDHNSFNNSINFPENKYLNKYCIDNRSVYEFKPFEKCNRKIYLNSLLSNVEIKSHDANSIKVEGSDIYFRYDGKYVCASSKLIEQAKSASDFIKNQFQIKNRAASFIYLPNVKKESLKVSNELYSILIFADSTFEEYIIKYIEQLGVKGKCLDDRKYNRLGDDQANLLHDNSKLLLNIEYYYKQLIPSSLEQEKMELLAKRYVDKNKEWCDFLGNKLIAFTGRAGTGKTVKLLRTAKDLADDYMDNVLLLTFNRPLARDLQRLMQLQKISSGSAITVLTIDQFLFRLAFRVGILNKIDLDKLEKSMKDKENSNESYNLVRELIAEEVKNDEKKNSIRKYFREYSMVAIDEAQDWFQDERDIILSIFEPNKIILAAGTDQCLRANTVANWKIDVQERGHQIHIVRSNIALRQTQNLSEFVNFLSEKLGLEWSVDSNKDFSGGEIYFFEEFNSDVLELFFKTKEKNVELIDFLFLMSKSGNLYKNKEVLKLLKKYKIDYWDTIFSKQDSLPELNKVRCVSLESCRGLEGWSTIIFDLDSWINFAKKREEEKNINFIFNNLASLPTWFLIPFTRAKKNMFIELPKNIELRNILLKLKSDFKDNIHLI